MHIRAVDRKQSLTTARDLVVYSAIATKHDEHAKDQTQYFQILLDEWAPLLTKQLALWDAQTEAMLVAHAADDILDGHIMEFADALKNKASNRVDYYFRGVTPSQMRRPVLGMEVDTVEGWIPTLEQENVPELKAFAPVFRADVKVARQAMAGQTKADEDNRRFREIGEQAAWFDKVEATRDKVFSVLEQRRVDNPDWNLPRDWALGFFPTPSPVPLTEEDRKAREAQRLADKLARDEKKAKEKAAKEKVEQAKKELEAVRHGK